MIRIPEVLSYKHLGVPLLVVARPVGSLAGAELEADAPDQAIACRMP